MTLPRIDLSRPMIVAVVAILVVMIVLLCLTPVFRNMPQNAQGAVIKAAVVGLFNYEEWWFLLRVSPQFLPFSLASLT